MMSRLVYMPIFPSDWLSESLHLSAEQFGMQMRLVLAMWNAGGALPNDATMLARIAGVSRKRWQQLSPEILRSFVVEGDRLEHSRLAADYQKGLDLVEKRAAAGKLGNAAKALKTKAPRSANAHETSTQTARLPTLTPTSTPTPTPTPTSTSGPTPAPTERDVDHSLGDVPMLVLNSEESPSRKKRSAQVGSLDADFDAFWAQYPKQIDVGHAKPAYRKARKIASATELLNGAMRYANEVQGRNSQYVKTPRNWLEGMSWRNAAQPSMSRPTNDDDRIAQVVGFLPRMPG